MSLGFPYSAASTIDFLHISPVRRPAYEKQRDHGVTYHNLSCVHNPWNESMCSDREGEA